MQPELDRYLLTPARIDRAIERMTRHRDDEGWCVVRAHGFPEGRGRRTEHDDKLDDYNTALAALNAVRQRDFSEYADEGQQVFILDVYGVTDIGYARGDGSVEINGGAVLDAIDIYAWRPVLPWDEDTNNGTL